MREVDFRYLQGTLESLNATTDLVLARGKVQVTLSRQCSPYVSHREVHFDLTPPYLVSDDVLLVANYRKIMVGGLTKDVVKQAAEAIGREGRPFEGDQLGWNGPRAEWVCEPVPSGLSLLRGIILVAHRYGLVCRAWLERPLIYAAWLVPVVVDWDENGRPVFDWPDRPAESETESEPVDRDLPAEA